MPRITRRTLLSKGAQTIAAGSAAFAAVPILATRAVCRESTAAVDYYQKLGVTPFINAAGTYTVLSASTMPDEVQAAVALAAKRPVHLNELLDASGVYLAKQLRCEAALVTAGAAAALVVGTAACVTMGNDQAILGIPTDIAGLKNEVLIQKSHRYDYEHAMRNSGIRFVEVETLEEYEQAFNDRTVMAHFFNAAEGKISREDWVRVARQHGVPSFNDAAADVPPISNLWKYTQMGFDLVTFSGGKGLRGPQCTGLLLGRKDLIEAAKKNLPGREQLPAQRPRARGNRSAEGHPHSRNFRIHQQSQRHAEGTRRRVQGSRDGTRSRHCRASAHRRDFQRRAFWNPRLGRRCAASRNRSRGYRQVDEGPELGGTDARPGGPPRRYQRGLARNVFPDPG